MLIRNRRRFAVVALPGARFESNGLDILIAALAYFPALSYLQEWFVRRRGLAIGITFAGASRRTPRRRCLV